MERYLNAPIKEVISKFPEVGRVLDEYRIGCVPCSVGSCLLKDIVAIHNLPKEEELELMYRIEKAIYPERDVKKPVFEKTAGSKSREIKYSPPIKRLVDEHALIKRWLALIPAALENFDINSESDRKLILDGVDFIRSYADKFHHAKEEDILFKYVDENLDIIKVIYEDHKTGRNHAKYIVEAVEKRDRNEAARHLNAYGELLNGHIKKEDEILYPWIDRGLSTTQAGELFAKFSDTDEKIGEEVPEKYRKFVETVEEKFKNQIKPRLMPASPARLTAKPWARQGTKCP